MLHLGPQQQFIYLFIIICTLNHRNSKVSVIHNELQRSPQYAIVISNYFDIINLSPYYSHNHIITRGLSGDQEDPF